QIDFAKMQLAGTKVELAGVIAGSTPNAVTFANLAIAFTDYSLSFTQFRQDLADYNAGEDAYKAAILFWAASLRANFSSPPPSVTPQNNPRVTFPVASAARGWTPVLTDDSDLDAIHRQGAIITIVPKLVDI